MTGRTHVATSLILFVTLSLAGGAVGADSMRCGQSIVNEETSVEDLIRKCGEPIERTSSTEDVYAVNAAGYRFKTGETTTTERWVYQRSPQALRMVVTIVDGVIKSIERAE
jgi:hypothetical protein